MNSTSHENECVPLWALRWARVCGKRWAPLWQQITTDTPRRSCSVLREVIWFETSIVPSPRLSPERRAMRYSPCH